MSIEEYHAFVNNQELGLEENKRGKNIEKGAKSGEGELELEEISRIVCKIILIILEHSRTLEFNKQYLLMQGDFSLEMMKKTMEINNEFTQENLAAFLSQIGLDTNQSTTDSVFQKYFPDPKDLSSVFSPNNPEYLNILNSAASTKFCKSTSKKLKKLFEEILIFETKIQKAHKKLSETLLIQVFQSIDQDNDGKITDQDLKSFFSKSGFSISNSDLSEILRSSRYLNYSDFLILLHR